MFCLCKMSVKSFNAGRGLDGSYLRCKRLVVKKADFG